MINVTIHSVLVARLTGCVLALSTQGPELCFLPIRRWLRMTQVPGRTKQEWKWKREEYVRNSAARVIKELPATKWWGKE